MFLNCSLNARIALKNMLEGNMGDQENSKVHLLCLSSYVENYCRMNISYACLREK